MNAPYLYLEINIICILVLGYLLTKYRDAQVLRYDLLLFRRFLAAGVLLCLSDVVWITIDGATFTGARELNWLINSLYYALCSICTFCWYIFAEHELCSETRRPSGNKRLLIVPLVLVIVIDLVSWHTGWIFSVDAANRWQRGPYYFIQVIVNCAYILLITFQTWREALAAKLYVTRRKLRSLTSFAVPASIGVILSQVFAGYTLTEVGLTLSALLVYLNLQEQRVSLDGLTRLNNRSEFQCVLEGKMNFLNPDKPLYLLVLDINKFKKINDEYGHIEGDQALKRMAQVLREVGDAYGCFIARFGGDEFLLLCEADEEQQILDLCADIRSALAASNVHSGVPYDLKMSIGYAVYDPAFKTPEEFVAQADAHMYEQKRKMQSATENRK
ncbi:MAG: GGDEF domain-containing protein [Acidaminococcaceae bacterium]|jgi:diguanylate cyclase (GGDEF)-like protein|nr:GGDEF domain-containing protein [Acidaminococcaceae bacterium]